MPPGRTIQHDVEDRLQRTLEENHQLKLQLKEKDEKLKRLQTQFRRLSADWKQSQDGSVRPGSSPSVSLTAPGSPASGQLPSLLRRSSGAAIAPSPPSTSRQVSMASGGDANSGASAAGPALAQAREEIAYLRSALSQQQQQQAPQRGRVVPSLSADTIAQQHHQQQQLEELSRQLTSERARWQQEQAASQQQLMQARQELQRTQGALQQQQQHYQQTHTTAGLASQQQLQQTERQYRDALDTITRERDSLHVRVRLLEEERKSAAGSPQPDPLSLIKLQAEVRDRTNQTTLLGSRLQSAQSQVEALKAECARLVEELKAAHNAHAETRKQIFELEQEKGVLQVRSSCLEEAEQSVQRKNEELVRMEQELLRLTDSLQSFNQETEQAVRRELNARVSDLVAMRDEADAQRREKERALLSCQSELAEVRRRMEGLSRDADMYRVELSKAERQRAELESQLSTAGHSVSEFTDGELHRALAVAAMRKRGAVRMPGAASTGAGADRASAEKAAAAATAEDALDLYDALHWDETWEQGQLREALATAALDMELAETRCKQMSDQVEQGRLALARVSEERDVLLEENMELRRRVTHVQTVLAKQQLQTYRAAAAELSASKGGSISVRLRGLRCETPAVLQALHTSSLSDPVAVFFTLDGLPGYDTMVSPTVHSLTEDPLDVHFLYDGLDRDETTLAVIQRTTFVLQLHSTTIASTADSAVGFTGSTIVAIAEIPGMALLAAREVAIDETLTLLDGNGNVLGELEAELCCARLMLPVLLGRGLTDADKRLLTAAEVRATLVSLRAVRYLRVQVFRAQDLPLFSMGTGPGSHDASSPHEARALADSLDELTGAAADGSTRAGERESAVTAAPANCASAPQPYVFYTASSSSAGALSCIRDTVVRPASNAFTTDPVFDAAPVDHRVAVDRELVRFLSQGTIAFIVFDERATDVRANLGIVEVPLHSLLSSPQALIRATEPLHPQGTISFGLSWVTTP